MAAINKPTKDTRFNENLLSAIVVRKGEIDPLIDRVNSITTDDGVIILNANGTVAAPSITAPGGVAGVYLTGPTVGFSTAGSHYAQLTGSGILTVLTTATTGGFAGSGTNQIVPITLCSAQETIGSGAGGAISVAKHYTDIAVDAGGDAFTLAAGVCIGQLKRIMLSATAGGTGVVTSTFAGAATTLTFTNAGESALLMWDGTDWIALELASVITTTHKPAIA